MTIINGIAYTHYGPRGMLNTEAGFAVLGIILFLAMLKYANGGSKAVA